MPWTHVSRVEDHTLPGSSPHPGRPSCQRRPELHRQVIEELKKLGFTVLYGLRLYRIVK
jgi:hypothetical protein